MDQGHRFVPVAVFLAAFVACDARSRGLDVTAGAEQVDEHGVVYAEHRIAGLRVLEVVVGGNATLVDRLPVVVSIHGRGDRVRLPSAGRFPGIDTAVRLILPEAPVAFNDGFTWSPVSVTENRPEELSTALAENAERIAQVLEWVATTREVVGKPVVTGFSQGGMLSFALAARHPSALGQAVPIAGLLPTQLVPRRAEAVSLPEIHAVNGTDDPVVRIGPTRRAVRRLRTIGYSATLDEVDGVRHIFTDALHAVVNPRLAAAIASERARDDELLFDRLQLR